MVQHDVVPLINGAHRRRAWAAVLVCGLALLLTGIALTVDRTSNATVDTFAPPTSAALVVSSTTAPAVLATATPATTVDMAWELSGPRTVLYTMSRTIGDVNLTVDVESDSPMLRNVHNDYKNAPMPPNSMIVRWPIPAGCYPDQSYTITTTWPNAEAPLVSRNYDYRFNGPSSVRILSNNGFPPSYERGVWYAIVRVYTPDVTKLALVVNDRVVDEVDVTKPTELLAALVARPELRTSNVRVRSFDSDGKLVSDQTPFTPYGFGTDPPRNVVGCS